MLSQKKSGNQNACVNQIDISSIEGDVDIISVSFIVAPFSKNDKCWQAFFFLVYFFPFFIFRFFISLVGEGGVFMMMLMIEGKGDDIMMDDRNGNR